MRKRLKASGSWKVLCVDLLFPISLSLLCMGVFAPILRVTKSVWFIELSQSTVSLFSGIEGFFQSGQYGLGSVLLAFTIAFPLSKLIVLALLWWRDLDSRSSKALFFLLRHIGHFSMVDVFVVAVIVVIVRMNALAEARALWGLYVFTLHVLASILLSIALERLSRESVDNHRPF